MGGLEKLQKHDCVIYEWSLVQVEEARRFIDAIFAAAFPPAVAVFAPATTSLIKVNNSYLSSIQKFNCNLFLFRKLWSQKNVEYHLTFDS